jgi:HD-like signal output (HDOD) protein
MNKTIIDKQSKTQGLQAWSERLQKQQMPVMGSIMRDINTLTKNDESSASQLAEVILRDASLTAKVLRVANSVHFKPSGIDEITTISRAIATIGIRGIRAVSLSVMLIDSLMHRHNKDRMLHWLARGFHAGVQAQNLIVNIAPNEKEEVFVAALLQHLGDILFWSAPTPEQDMLDKLLPPKAGVEAEYEQQILGTTLRSLGYELAQKWEVGELVEQCMGDPSNPSKSVQAVLLAERISLAAEMGWQSLNMKQLIRETALFCNISPDEADNLLRKGAAEAASMAVNYGANTVCAFIPPAEDPQDKTVRKPMKADAKLQLNILRELGVLVNEGGDINSLFQTLVEGVHRGVGMERVTICLLNPREKNLQPKYLLGDIQTWRERLKLPVRNEQDNLLAYTLLSRQTLFLQRNKPHGYGYLIDNRLAELIDSSNCMLAALYAANRPLGVIMADRGMEGETINQEQYDSFVHFVQQVNMGLALISQRRTPD